MKTIMTQISDLYKEETIEKIAPILKNRTEEFNEVVKMLRNILNTYNNIYFYLEKIDSVMWKQNVDGLYYFNKSDWFFFGMIFNKQR